MENQWFLNQQSKVSERSFNLITRAYNTPKNNTSPNKNLLNAL